LDLPQCCGRRRVEINFGEWPKNLKSMFNKAKKMEGGGGTLLNRTRRTEAKRKSTKKRKIQRGRRGSGKEPSFP